MPARCCVAVTKDRRRISLTDKIGGSQAEGRLAGAATCSVTEELLREAVQFR